jgi:hypothetical protein
MQRRTFLCWLISGSTAASFRSVRLHAQAAALPLESVAVLRALAPVMLPSDLRAAGHDRVVSDFVRWLASYRSGAERNWGYGHPRKSGLPTIEIRHYAAQLRDLDTRARRRGGLLQKLSTLERRDLVIESLQQAGLQELPSAPNGGHVLADFMSFFYTSGAAYDLAYRARVARVTCRGLSGSTARPTPSTVGD